MAPRNLSAYVDLAKRLERQGDAAEAERARTSLVEQLGKRYLRGESLTHGIFFVGWSGKWRPGTRKGVRDLYALRSFLLTQRNNYVQKGAEGDGLRIEPFVMDLSYPITTPIV